MAKGNDGNLLQHTCELAAMRAIIHAVGVKRFHLYCTHAMAPSEVCETVPNPAGREQLTRALNLAAAQSKALPTGTKLKTSPLIDVLSRLNASTASYPNTARILSSEAERLGVALSAVLVDTDADVETALRASFATPPIRVFRGDWRKPIARFRSYDAPWLFTMDPDTFSTRRTPSGIDARDLRLVAEHIDRDLAAHLGVVTVFGYAMVQATREAFWEAVVDAFGHHEVEFLAVAARAASKRHVAAVICADKDVLTEVIVEAHDHLDTVNAI
jgi:hypothetical protein